MKNLKQNGTNKRSGLKLESPVTANGSLTNYAKILDFVAINPQKEGFTKLELLTYALPKTFGPLSDESQTTAGYYSNIFSMFSLNEIIIFNCSEKVWKKGVNFEQYFSENITSKRS